MPPHPTIRRSPLKNAFVCAQCNRNFQSKSGHIRHINAKHICLPMNSPQSTEDDFSEVSSSCPGSLCPAPSPLSHVFESPLPDFDFGGENDFNFGNSDIDNIPPLSPLGDMSTEYHPYLNGKVNKI
jgi:hypothetical protein